MKVDISINESEKNYSMNLKVADAFIREYVDFDSPMSDMCNKCGLIALEEVAEHILAFVKSINKAMNI